MNELFFIPIVLKAIERQHSQGAILEAFDEIFESGREAPYQTGFDQFLRFMNEVAAQVRQRDDYLESIELEVMEALLTVEIIVERNGRKFATVPCIITGFKQMITNVKPGKFVFKLNLGRVLWTGELGVEDLIWSAAFPGEALRLAAETGRAAPKVSRTIPVIRNELFIRVIPGIENGSIEIVLRGDTK